jgi:caffeoyl-CoA O-methyltransferase
MRRMADKDSRAGERYADKDLLDYIARVHAGHDTALEAAFSAPAREDMPAIMVGPSEGRLLGLLLTMIKAEKVVEIGTLAGYSAIQMARALPSNGRLWSVEADARYAEVARGNLELAGHGERVEVVVGAALDVLPGLEEHGPFDAVFIDADKGNYDRYGRWAAANLRPGGVLLGDNAFLFGDLLDATETAAAMRRFHEEAAEAFHSVCIPTPDGLLLGIRRG